MEGNRFRTLACDWLKTPPILYLEWEVKVRSGFIWHDLLLKGCHLLSRFETAMYLTLLHAQWAVTTSLSNDTCLIKNKSWFAKRVYNESYGQLRVLNHITHTDCIYWLRYTLAYTFIKTEPVLVAHDQTGHCSSLFQSGLRGVHLQPSCHNASV